MEYKYPIEYAKMPIYENIEFDLGGKYYYEKKDEIVCYIVSKVYIINKNINYDGFGQQKEEYEVVFPYQKGSYRNPYGWERVYPNKTFYSNSCSNSEIIYELYESYEEAKKEVEKENEEILIRNMSRLLHNFEETSAKLKAIHKYTLDKYKKLEEEIEKETLDMIVKKISKKQSIIILYQGENQILDISIYDLIKLYKYFPFYVYNVSEVDLKNMKNQIQKSGTLERILATVTKPVDEKFRYLLVNDLEENVIRIANPDSEDSTGSYYLDSDNVLCYDNGLPPFSKDFIFSRKESGIKIYTTKTYEDIINHYQMSNKLVDTNFKNKNQKMIKMLEKRK